MSEKNHDTVNHPDHYTQGGVECIDALEAATAGLRGIEAVCTANTIKYMWRWKHKNGLEDLRKAKWYLTHLIAKVEKDGREDEAVTKRLKKANTYLEELCARHRAVDPEDAVEGACPGHFFRGADKQWPDDGCLFMATPGATPNGECAECWNRLYQGEELTDDGE